MQTNRLYGLDALRGIAAAVVVIGHLRHITQAPWPTTNYALSVDFFFMLSGYVMARTYEERLASRGLGAFRFLWARFRRLWPTMAVGTLLGFAVWFYRDSDLAAALPALVAGLLFLPWSLRTPWLYPFNGPSWSILNELLANLIHGLVLARCSSRVLFVLLIASGTVFSGWVLATGVWPAGGWPDQFVPALVRTIACYILGILLYRRFRDRDVLRTGLWPLLLAFPAAVLATAWLPDWMDLIFVFALSPLLVLAGAGCQVSERGARWAAASGAISFPLYAVHYPLLEMLTTVATPGQALAIVLAALALLALLLAEPIFRFPPAPARGGGSLPG